MPDGMDVRLPCVFEDESSHDWGYRNLIQTAAGDVFMVATCGRCRTAILAPFAPSDASERVLRKLLEARRDG